MLKCPHCERGSDRLLRKAVGKDEWAQIECGACEESFELGAAVDRMFMKGDPTGYRWWAGCKVVETHHTVRDGETDIEDVSGEFESAYDIIKIEPWFEGGVSGMLAGGLSTKYIPQGYVMVAVAPSEGTRDRIHDIQVLTIGRDPDGPQLPPWQELLVQARIGGHREFRVAPVNAVSAMDLYVESLSPDEDFEVPQGRPGSWNDAVADFLGVELKTIEGGSLVRLDHLVEIRNALAHGRDYLKKVREPLASEERIWLDRRHLYDEEYRRRLTPVGEFAVESVLGAIRNCMRYIKESLEG